MKKVMIFLVVAFIAVFARAQLSPHNCHFEWTGNSSGDLGDTNNWDQVDPSTAGAPTGASPAERLPNNSDTVNIDANYFGTTAPSSGTCIGRTIFVAYDSASGIYEATLVHITSADFNGTVIGNAFFDGAASLGGSGVVSNNAIFVSTSMNIGTVNGNAIFTESAQNLYTVSSNAILTGTVINDGFILGNAILSDSALSDSSISGNAFFHGTSTSLYGTVSGDAGFWDAAVNSGTVSGNIVMPIPASGGGINGSSILGMP